MGKDKVRKRISLQQQFAISYIKFLFFSVITSVITVTTFYMIYCEISGNSSKSFIMVDVGITLVCFVAYMLLFTGRLSKDIKNPLNELMSAVEKIKNHDLEFTIKSAKENEIGDLTRAIEDMRESLKCSLIREWQLEQDRREMVSAITHDLRTPLAIIQGHVEGLQGGLKYNSEKLDTYLGIIGQSANRAKKLISDMNELTEIDSQGFTLNQCSVSPLEFVKTKTNELTEMAGKKGIDVEARINDTREDKGLVSLDPNRLSQVIDNIISNSLRFTPNGGKIQVHTMLEEKKISFRICDSGPGFDETDISKIFKKFYKSDPARSREKGHSGLGLYIAGSIIEKHGGTIKASNLPEGGACVEFYVTV